MHLIQIRITPIEVRREKGEVRSEKGEVVKAIISIIFQIRINAVNPAFNLQ